MTFQWRLRQMKFKQFARTHARYKAHRLRTSENDYVMFFVICVSWVTSATAIIIKTAKTENEWKFKCMPCAVHFADNKQYDIHFHCVRFHTLPLRAILLLMLVVIYFISFLFLHSCIGLRWRQYTSILRVCFLNNSKWLWHWTE